MNTQVTSTHIQAMGRFNLLKRIIGIAEYKRGSEIIEFLKERDSSQNFCNTGYLLLESNKEFRLWLIASASHAFIVIDDGFSLKILLRRAKDDFQFEIIKKKKSLRLDINETTTTLPINAVLTGGMEGTKKSIENFIAHPVA